MAQPFSRILHSWDAEAERLRALRNPPLSLTRMGTNRLKRLPDSTRFTAATTAAIAAMKRLLWRPGQFRTFLITRPYWIRLR